MKSNIGSMYYRKNTNRIIQGDIFKDIKIPIYEGRLNIVESGFLVVLSQDCDLNQDYYSRIEMLEINFDESDKKISSFNNRRIPSILVCPAYPANQVLQGTHLNFLGIEMSKIGKEKDTRWKLITQNEIPRYHYLKSGEFNTSNLVIDFKRYYTISRDYLYSVSKDSYMCSLNELYRERLSQRFVNYLSRIGLPGK